MNNITESTINNLNNLEIEELKVIAKSIGIQVSNNNEKQEIIDKIIFIVEKNKTTIENKSIKNNNNPFNKTSFDQLTISNDKQGEIELLFWKLIKNKSIFKSIMSFMNNKSNSLQYECLISVNQMLENGQIEIIKDKIKRNKYVVFSSPPKKSISIIKSLEDIFGKIKDDKEFYHCLFKNYKYQIIELNNGDIGLSVLTNLSIKLNCSVAFQVLVEEYKFIPTINDLLFSFKSNNLESSKYIVSLLDPLLINQLSVTTTNDDINKYIDYFSHSSFQVDNTIGNFEIFNKIFKPTKETIKQHWVKLLANNFTSQIYSYSSLEIMLRSIESYNYFDPAWELYENSTLESIPPLSIRTADLIDQFKAFRNSNSPLCCTLLRDPSLYLSSERETIKIFLVIYFRIMHSLGKTLDTTYVDRFNNHFGDINKSMDLHPFEYGHYPSIEIWGKHKSLNFIQLFSRQPKKELQIQFLNTLIQDIKNGNPSVSSKDMFTSLLKYNDLEVLKHWVSELGNEYIVTDYLKSHSDDSLIFKYIKSTTIMDYIFNEFYQLIDTPNDTDGMESVIKIQITDITLLKHYQKLHLNKQNKERSSIKKKLYIVGGGYTVEIVEFYSNDLSVYENYQGLIKYIPIDFNIKNQETLFNSLKIAVTSDPLIDIKELFINREYNTYCSNQYSDNYKKFPSFYYIQFLNWYNIKFNNLIKQEIISKSKLNIQYFTFGYHDQLFQCPSTSIDETTLSSASIILNYSSDIVRHSINRGDLNTLDLILNTLLNHFNGSSTIVTTNEKESISNFIYKEIMMEIINSQQIYVLDHILLNHCQLFKVKSISDNSIFTEDNFISLFSLSVSLRNVKITQVLLNILSITRDQFETYAHSSSIIYYHFIDKFNK